MIRRLLSNKFSFVSPIKSDFTIYNNIFSLESLGSSMMLYVVNPIVYTSEDSHETQMIRVGAGRVGFHLVQTRLAFTKGVSRSHYHLTLNDLSHFMNHQYHSTIPLRLQFFTPEPNSSKNMDIRSNKSVQKTMMTFYDLKDNKVQKLKRIAVEESQMIVMKQIMRSGLYDLSGMDLEYSFRYEQMLDQIVAQANEESLEQNEIETRQEKEKWVDTDARRDEPVFRLLFQDEQLENI